MEVLITLLGVLVVLGMFDLAAINLGADSRDPIGDTHRQSTQGGR